MIVNDNDAKARLASPGNLINRLHSADNKSSKNSAMSLFGIGRKKEVTSDNGLSVSSAIASISEERKDTEIKISFNPFQPQAPSAIITPSESPALDEILEDHEAKIKLGLAHDRSIDLLNRSVEMLSAKLDDIKADKLPAVIAAASKTIDNIRRERNEQTKNGKDKEVHYHFYTPQQNKITDYEVIDVT